VYGDYDSTYVSLVTLGQTGSSSCGSWALTAQSFCIISSIRLAKRWSMDPTYLQRLPSRPGALPAHHKTSGDMQLKDSLLPFMLFSTLCIPQET
jgi:hypothetical protein